MFALRYLPLIPVLLFGLEQSFLCQFSFATAPQIYTLTDNASTQKANSVSQEIRIPGEFERQRSIVFSVSDWQPHHAYVLTQLVEKTLGHIDVLILHNDLAQQKMVIEWLRKAKVPTSHVSFRELNLDTIWLRDFSPVLAESASKPIAIDFNYVGGQRPKDEKMPHRWSELTDCQLLEVPWTLQGGNFLTNGRHLALTTQRIFKDNFIQFQNPLPNTDIEVERRKIVTDVLQTNCNIQELVVLEPLESEAT